MHRKRYLVVAVAFIALVPQAAHARSGDIDRQFGRYGSAVADIGGYDFMREVKAQSDGKILAGGTTYKKNADFGVARFTSNGALDKTFGGRGHARTDFGGNDALVGVAGAPGGKVIAAGMTSKTVIRNDRPAIVTDFAIARYTSKGALDKTFSGNGMNTTDFFGDQTGGDIAVGLVVQPDGKPIVAGYTTTHTYAEGPNNTVVDASKIVFVLARYGLDGELDPTFGTGGRAVIEMGQGRGTLGGIALQKDGFIVLVGSFQRAADDETPFDMLTFRLTPVGSLDPTYGTGGKAVTDFYEADDFGSAVAVAPDGTIFVGGMTTRYGKRSSSLMRLTSSGSLDKTFSGDGKVAVSSTVASYFLEGIGLYSIAVQSDGKPLVLAMSSLCSTVRYGGRSFTTCTSWPGVTRFSKSGALDKS